MVAFNRRTHRSFEPLMYRTTHHRARGRSALKGLDARSARDATRKQLRAPATQRGSAAVARYRGPGMSQSSASLRSARGESRHGRNALPQRALADRRRVPSDAAHLPARRDRALALSTRPARPRSQCPPQSYVLYTKHDCAVAGRTRGAAAA